MPELADQHALSGIPPRRAVAFTTNATSCEFASNLLGDRAGASYRQVIDVGNWDAATMTNAPGQSGDPRSPFYDNLLQAAGPKRNHFHCSIAVKRCWNTRFFRITPARPNPRLSYAQRARTSLLFLLVFSLHHMSITWRHQEFLPESIAHPQ